MNGNGAARCDRGQLLTCFIPLFVLSVCKGHPFLTVHPDKRVYHKSRELDEDRLKWRAIFLYQLSMNLDVSQFISGSPEKQSLFSVSFQFHEREIILYS